MRKPLVPALVVLVSASLVALSGCSAPTGPDGKAPPTSSTVEPSHSAVPSSPEDGQSREEACRIADEAAKSVQAQASEALANPADTAVVSAALKAVESRLAEVMSAITHPEVHAAAAEVQDHFARVSRLFGAVQAGDATQEQVAELQGAVQDMRASIDDVRRLCG